MRVWMGNVASGTTDDEIRDFVKKYAPNLECTEIQRVEGTGTHPGVMLSFTGATSTELANLALRLHGMYWKGSSLNCHTMIT